MGTTPRGGGLEIHGPGTRTGDDSLQDPCREAPVSEREAGAVQGRVQVKAGCESRRGMTDIVLRQEEEEGAGSREWGGSAPGGGPTTLPLPTVLAKKLRVPADPLLSAEAQGNAGPGRTPVASACFLEPVRISKDGAALMAAPSLDGCAAGITLPAALKSALQPSGVPSGVLEELESIRLSRKHIAR